MEECYELRVKTKCQYCGDIGECHSKKSLNYMIKTGCPGCGSPIILGRIFRKKTKKEVVKD